jgi:flagellar basal body-associated protein FliL
MKKFIIIVVAVIVIGILVALFVQSRMSNESTAAPTSTTTPTTTTTSTATSTSSPATNTHGFAIKFPASVANYSVEKSDSADIIGIHPPASVPGQIFNITVNYSSGGSDVVGSIAIIPASEWSSDLCQGIAPCDPGNVVASTSAYVYQEWSIPADNPYSDSPCTQEPHCSVQSFFDNLPTNGGFVVTQ